jgi:hypothetical protein
MDAVAAACDRAALLVRKLSVGDNDSVTWHTPFEVFDVTA